MQKRLLAIILLFLLLPGFLTPAASAQTPQAVADAEAERNKQLAKELSLNIPDVTDDPNYPVTFVDPSKKGVEITINDKTTANAPTPFLLPNLAIGKYSISFKFTNKDGLLRVLTKDLIVAPKPPIFDQTIKTSVVRPNQVVVSGSGLPQSTIMLVVNSTVTYKFSVNQEGKWEYILPDPSEGKLNIMGFVIRNGYISEASKVITVDYKLRDDGQSPIDTNVASTSAVKQTYDNIVNFINTHPNEFYLVTGISLAIVIILVAISMRRGMNKKREEKSIADLFGNYSNNKTILDIVSPTQIKKEENKAKKEAEKKGSDTQKPEAKKEDKSEEKSTEEVKEKIIPAVSESTKVPAVDISNKKVSKAGDIKPKIEEKPKAKKDTKVTAKTDSKKEGIVKQKEEPSSPKSENVKLDTKHIEDEKDIETTKKILSKEEFLKQFQTKKK